MVVIVCALIQSTCRVGNFGGTINVPRFRAHACKQNDRVLLINCAWLDRCLETILIGPNPIWIKWTQTMIATKYATLGWRAATSPYLAICMDRLMLESVKRIGPTTIDECGLTILHNADTAHSCMCSLLYQRSNRKCSTSTSALIVVSFFPSIFTSTSRARQKVPFALCLSGSARRSATLSVAAWLAAIWNESILNLFGRAYVCVQRVARL